jgi:hypothetical protein
MLKVIPATPNGKPVHFEQYDVVGENGDLYAISIVTPALVHASFKSVTRTTAGTTIVTAPNLGGAIIISDIVVTSDKTNATNVTVRFTDGTNTINLLVGDSTNNSINLAIAFAGKVQGWKNARLEVVTTGNVTATVTCVYYKTKKSLDFQDWNARR